MTNSCITTFSSFAFDPLDPDQSRITVQDIAHSLARLVRFNGHYIGEHYSVAEHCIWVSRELEQQGASNETQWWGLMHDAGEAYLLGDVPGPTKQAVILLSQARPLDPPTPLVRAETSLLQYIARALGRAMYSPEQVSAIHRADLAVRQAEQEQIMPAGIAPTGVAAACGHCRMLGPSEAEMAFLQRYWEIVGRL
jgi:hypothetical protein